MLVSASQKAPLKAGGGGSLCGGLLPGLTGDGGGGGGQDVWGGHRAGLTAEETEGGSAGTRGALLKGQQVGVRALIVQA